MRIAVISRVFSKSGGGAESYSVALVQQLAARHEIHVFAQESDQPVPGVTYHCVSRPMKKPRWINQLWFAAATWWATRRGFDVVHSHENTWHGQVQTVHVLPIKYSLFHGRTGWRLGLRWLKVATSPRLLAYLWLESARYGLRGKRCIVLASTSLRAIMAQTYPAAVRAMTVVTPGVACVPGLASEAERQEARRHLGLPAQGRCILFVGNDYRKKGLPALLQAMRYLPDEVCLAVVGNAAQIAGFQDEVRASGLEKRIFFLGTLKDIDPAYCAADCLAHPTLEDTFAMVVLEAMAHGLPVVVSGPAYCGISQQLTDGADAWLLADPKDAKLLSERIRTVLDQPELAAQLRQRGLAFAQAHSWERAALQYEALYLDCHCGPDPQSMLSMVSPHRQRWLILAHAFNMDGRAASQTITDKLPHLRRAGIELVVLSGVSGTRDTAVEHHQLWPAGPAGLRFELRHVLRRRVGKGLAYRALMTLASLFLLPGMLVEKLLRPVESSWTWWLSAYLKGRALARQQPFDLIYSTGGAFAAHVAGRALKNATGTPWLAEVHDPMVTPGTAPQTAQQKIQAAVEHLICNEADVAIWFTEQALASARQRHPQLGERGKMMLPGIDRPFKQLPPYRPGAKFIIGHFGSLSATRNLAPIVSALERLQADRPDLVALTELHVYGGPLDAVSREKIANSPVRDCMRHFGRIEADPQTGLSGREQILHRMRAVDVLLLLHGEDPLCEEYIPSKLYEYLWMQRPILAIVHRNPQMAALIRGQGHVAVGPGEEGNGSSAVSGELAAALEKLFDRWRTQGLADSGRDSPYTTEAAVGQLLGWVNSALSAR